MNLISQARQSIADDPFRYGWRDVIQQRPDGSTERKQVPLTLHDVLRPQLGDVIVNGSFHGEIRRYLASVFRCRLASQAHALVLSDTGVYWDIPELGHHSPDIAVILGVREQRANWSSFDVAEQGVRPRLIIEVVSPRTRSTDVVDKFQHYHQAGVPVYVIVDRQTEDGPVRVLGYQHAPGKYLPMPADERGRLWLEAVGLWLGPKGDRVICYRADSDEEMGDYTAVVQALATVKLRADAETERAEAEKSRADTEKARAAAAESRARHLEAELAQLRQHGTQEQ